MEFISHMTLIYVDLMRFYAIIFYFCLTEFVFHQKFILFWNNTSYT